MKYHYARRSHQSTPPTLYVTEIAIDAIITLLHQRSDSKAASNKETSGISISLREQADQAASIDIVWNGTVFGFKKHVELKAIVERGCRHSRNRFRFQLQERQRVDCEALNTSYFAL